MGKKNRRKIYSAKRGWHYLEDTRHDINLTELESENSSKSSSDSNSDRPKGYYNPYSTPINRSRWEQDNNNYSSKNPKDLLDYYRSYDNDAYRDIHERYKHKTYSTSQYGSWLGSCGSSNTATNIIAQHILIHAYKALKILNIVGSNFKLIYYVNGNYKTCGEYASLNYDFVSQNVSGFTDETKKTEAIIGEALVLGYISSIGVNLESRSCNLIFSILCSKAYDYISKNTPGFGSYLDNMILRTYADSLYYDKSVIQKLAVKDLTECTQPQVTKVASFYYFDRNNTNIIYSDSFSEFFDFIDSYPGTPNDIASGNIVNYVKASKFSEFADAFAKVALDNVFVQNVNLSQEIHNLSVSENDIFKPLIYSENKNFFIDEVSFTRPGLELSSEEKQQISIFKEKFKLTTKTTEDYPNYGLGSGDLDEGAFHKVAMKSSNVFLKKELKSKSLLDLCLIIDKSGSMTDVGKWRYAFSALKVLYESIKDNSIVKTNIYAHTGDFLGVKVTNVITDSNRDKANLLKLPSTFRPAGGNYDYVAFPPIIDSFISEAREGSAKLVIHISDGLPNGTNGNKSTKSVIEFYGQRNIPVLGIFIGTPSGREKSNLEYIYGNNLLIIEDFDNLATYLSRLILKKVELMLT